MVLLDVLSLAKVRVCRGKLFTGILIHMYICIGICIFTRVQVSVSLYLEVSDYVSLGRNTILQIRSYLVWFQLFLLHLIEFVLKIPMHLSSRNYFVFNNVPCVFHESAFKKHHSQNTNIISTKFSSYIQNYLLAWNY